MYIVTPATPHSRQITFEEMIDGITDSFSDTYEANNSTLTRWFNALPAKYPLCTDEWIKALHDYNEKYAELESSDLASHYNHFTIPKKSGGLRPIDAPDKELMDALRELQKLLKSFMLADHHNAAHAYIENRSILSAAKKHQFGHPKTKRQPDGTFKSVTYQNNWGVSFDFHGFFPSTTIVFLEAMFSKIYPFNFIMADTNGRTELHKALSLCFLHGGLPQGTPISPWLTNVMMIPFDYCVNKQLNNYKMKDGVSRDFTYTRYADDIDISCYLSFDAQEIQEDVIKNALNRLGAPFTLNESKTHYGNRHSSKNWILGLQWNANNEITVGWRNLKTFKATITAYLNDKKNGVDWSLEDVQRFNGTINYYRQVEKDVIDGIISRYNTKFGADLMALIKADLKPLALTA